MDILIWFEPLFDKHIYTAALLGAIIGLEREIAGKDPSLRTFALISMGSCIFGILSHTTVSGIAGGDPSRIAAQVVAGIGFIGAGAIFRSPKGVSGLTTAALMWATAGIGLAVGFDRFDLAFSATIAALLVTLCLNIVHQIIRWIRGEDRSTLMKSE
jgi:putative Mg2+ transporter-C (MgtC) family protein